MLVALLLVSFLSLACQAGNGSGFDDVTPSVERSPRGRSVAADSPAGGAAGKTARVVRTQLVRELRESSPHVNTKEMFGFYREHFPAALSELNALCAEGEGAAEPCLRRMVRRYARYRAFAAGPKDELARELAIDRLELEARRLSRRIGNLREAASAKDGADRRRSRKELAAAQERLLALLREVFEVGQQNQLIEVNRLEAELRDMRRLLDEREANKDTIVRRRYRELVGDSDALPSPGGGGAAR